MATIADINAQKQVAVDILDRKIFDAIQQKNAGGLSPSQASALDRTIHDLMAQRQAVFVQAYNGAMGSKELADALAALSAATAEMNAVAAHMTTATTIIGNAAAFLSAAGKVVSVLKGS